MKKVKFAKKLNLKKGIITRLTDMKAALVMGGNLCSTDAPLPASDGSPMPTCRPH